MVAPYGGPRQSAEPDTPVSALHRDLELLLLELQNAVDVITLRSHHEGCASIDVAKLGLVFYEESRTRRLIPPRSIHESRDIALCDQLSLCRDEDPHAVYVSIHRSPRESTKPEVPLGCAHPDPLLILEKKLDTLEVAICCCCHERGEPGPIVFRHLTQVLLAAVEVACARRRN
eukprot:XP_001707359.1 Hypothetical protein GL50803_97112 [Giardia lamblia ATCC 50803]